MTLPSSAEQFSDEIHELQSQIGALQERVQLTTARNEVEELNVNIHGLGDRIQSLRTRGYIFEKELEDNARELLGSWSMQYPILQSQISAQTANLVTQLQPIELQFQQLASTITNPVFARQMLANLQSSLSILDGKASSSEKSIEDIYEPQAVEIDKMTTHLDEVEFMIDQLSEAPFQLLPAESGIAAIKAVWCQAEKEQKDDPEGVLFLTDERLLFERKENIATKKFYLFPLRRK